MAVDLYHGDCLDVMRAMDENTIDSVVTDAPYGLLNYSPDDIVKCLSAWIKDETFSSSKKGFMNKSWDQVPGPDIWKEVYRVMKPGAHLLCFAGSRSMDLMSIAIRLGGFELRDNIGFINDGGNAPLMAWVYSSAMPHGQNVSKAMTDPKDSEKWNDWHSGLKPAFEPIIIARKPFDGKLVDNVLKYGTGALNIGESRIELDMEHDASQLRTMKRNIRLEDTSGQKWGMSKNKADEPQVVNPNGRFPSNIIHDGSERVMDDFASYGEKSSGKPGVRRKNHGSVSMSKLNMTGETERGFGDSGTVDRFFKSTAFTDLEKKRFIYQAKANKTDRAGSKHVSVKPVKLMEYLVRLVTPPDGVVLDPFAGSGTTGEAAVNLGFNAILIEQDETYVNDCHKRLGMFVPDGIKKV